MQGWLALGLGQETLEGQGFARVRASMHDKVRAAHPQEQAHSPAGLRGADTGLDASPQS